MLEMAVRRRFDIDTEKAARKVNQLMDSNDERIATRVLAIAALMESINQKDQHKVIDVHVTKRLDRLDGIAAGLGVDVSVIENAQREAGGCIGGTKDQGENRAAE